jgi:hypothetical protein
MPDLSIEPSASSITVPTFSLPLRFRTRRKFGLDRFDIFFLLAIAVCYVLVARLPFAPSKYGDRDFHDEAKALAGAIRGVNPWKEFQIFRAPGPVFYYALPYLAVPPGSPEGRYWLAGFLWTAGWMAVAALLIRRAASRLAGELAGRISALLLLITPFWAYYTFGINGESEAFLGAALCSYGWVRSQGCVDTTRARRCQIAVFSIGLSLFLLSKPNAVLVLVFLLFAAAAARARGRKREVGSLLACLLLAFLVMGLANGLSRFTTRDRPTSPQISYLRWTMFFGSFQFRTETWDWRFWDRATRRGSLDYEMFSQEFARLNAESVRQKIPLSNLEWNWVLQDVIHHPLLRLKMAAVRAMALNVFLVNSRPWEEFRLGPLRGRAGYIAFHIALNVLNLVVLVVAIHFLAVRRTEFVRLWVFWGPWLALLLFHSAVYAEARYLFPGEPGLIILASTALAPRMTFLRPLLRI